MSTFATGEVVTAAKLNKILNISAASLLNPVAVASWFDSTGGAWFGDATDHYDTVRDIADGVFAAVSCPINWNNYLAFSSTVQWRVSTVFNCSAALGGGGTLPTWIGRYALLGSQGATTALGSATSIGSAQAISNSTGVKAADSGWQTAPTGDGVGMYHFYFRMSRTGGTAGSVTNINLMVEARVQ